MRGFLCVAAAALVLGAGVAPALAADAGNDVFAHTHARRAEVNGRLATQDQRVTNELRDGQITPGQATALRSQDRTMQSEERAMAATDGGHITRQDQRILNQQENGERRELNQ